MSSRDVFHVLIGMKIKTLSSVFVTDQRSSDTSPQDQKHRFNSLHEVIIEFTSVKSTFLSTGKTCRDICSKKQEVPFHKNRWKGTGNEEKERL